jgi:asparagine synthase (glutamine-hydrolysing)
MCRIYGGLGIRKLDIEQLRVISNSMFNGGPDEQNYMEGSGWLIGTNRLAIQSLSGGHQPYQYLDSIFISFNGEIYNHRKLRADLIKAGFNFTDDSDGNIIGPLYQVHGPGFVSLLDGMFAIAILDLRTNHTLRLYTDPAAIKSVYFHWNKQDGSLIFASEIEALQLLAHQRFEIDSFKIYDYLSLRSICGEHTIYKDIDTLGPSRMLTFTLAGMITVETYQSNIRGAIPSDNLELSGQQLQKMLTAELEQMTESEVPICAVISGGLDSTFIAALASKYIKDLHSFHISYKGNWPEDEQTFADEAAKFIGTTHHNIVLDPDDIPDLIERVASKIGQPNAAPHSISTYALFESIHKQGFKVALTGEGADELFAGYARFAYAFESNDNWIDNYFDKFGPFRANLINEILSSDFLASINRDAATAGEFKKRIFSVPPGPERLDVLQSLDQWDRFPYYILRRVDHLSMAHSVEVRVPFCQTNIIDFARLLPANQRIADNQCKAVVYEAAKELVPASIINRPKQPFTLPISAMIHAGSKLHDYMMSVFSDQVFRNREHFNHDKILKYCTNYVKKPDNNIANMLWSVLQYEVWNRYSVQTIG